MTKRNVVITEATGQFIEDVPVEIVERKGIGHPDSLCDGMAERISVEYTHGCQENLGVLLHHRQLFTTFLRGAGYCWHDLPTPSRGINPVVQP